MPECHFEPLGTKTVIVTRKDQGEMRETKRTTKGQQNLKQEKGTEQGKLNIKVQIGDMCPDLPYVTVHTHKGAIGG